MKVEPLNQSCRGLVTLRPPAAVTRLRIICCIVPHDRDGWIYLDKCAMWDCGLSSWRY